MRLGARCAEDICAIKVYWFIDWLICTTCQNIISTSHQITLANVRRLRNALNDELLKQIVACKSIACANWHTGIVWWKQMSNSWAIMVSSISQDVLFLPLNIWFHADICHCWLRRLLGCWSGEYCRRRLPSSGSMMGWCRRCWCIIYAYLGLLAARAGLYQMDWGPAWSQSPPWSQTASIAVASLPIHTFIHPSLTLFSSRLPMSFTEEHTTLPSSWPNPGPICNHPPPACSTHIHFPTALYWHLSINSFSMTTPWPAAAAFRGAGRQYSFSFPAMPCSYRGSF